MKKILSLYFLFLIIFLVGCSSTDRIITDNALDYIYKANEKINIYDNANARELLGSLTVVSMNVLSNDEFVIKEPRGFDENDQPVYTETTYKQLVQINYVYQEKKGHKAFNESNFKVFDSANKEGKNNPKISYEKVNTDGMRSFVTALKTKSDTININFSYNSYYSYDAKIQLSVKDNTTSYSEKQETPTTNSALKSKIAEQTKEIDSLKAQIEERNKEIDSLKTQIANKTSQIEELNLNKLENKNKLIACFAVITLLLTATVVLICILCVKARANNKTTLL